MRQTITTLHLCNQFEFEQGIIAVSTLRTIYGFPTCLALEQNVIAVKPVLQSNSAEGAFLK